MTANSVGGLGVRRGRRLGRSGFWLAALLLLLPLGVVPPPASASPLFWQVERVDARGVVEQVSLVLDSDGNPHIAYYESSGKDLRYARWDGSAWTLQDVDTAGTVGFSPSVVVDSSGRAHILYVDGSRERLKNAWSDGTAWAAEDVDDTGAYVTGLEDAQWTRAVMDASDVLHVCYTNNTAATLRYARFSGGTWVRETVDGGTWGVGFECSIAIDATRFPHITYRNESSGSLAYAAWNGTAWNVTTVDSVEGVRDWTSLALDAAGHPYISYVPRSVIGGKISYWDGVAWRTLVPAASTHFSPAIAFDAQGRLHAPTWGFPPGVTNYTLWDGTWMNESFPAEFRDATDLALDADGLPHLAWARNGDLYYARAYATPQRPSAPRNLDAVGGDGQVSLTWTAPAWDGGSPVTGYRVYRGTSPNPATAVATLGNVTAYTDTGLTNGVTYFYRVAAVNTIAEGPPSNEVTAIPSGPGDDPPVCAITFPSGGTVSGNVTIRGTATDPENALDRVEVRVDDGSWIAANGTASWTHAWNSSAVVDGSHTVEARAYDGAQYSAPCSASVTTSNGIAPPPDGNPKDFWATYGWVILLLAAVLSILCALVLIFRRRKKTQSLREGEHPRGPKTLLLAFLLVAATLTALSTIPQPVLAYTPHAPILIDGNAGFTSANGVTGGSGTPNDPYIIEGWEIVPTSSGGITVVSSNASLVIRNVYVHSSPSSGLGVVAARNIRVERSTFEGNSDGIRLTTAANVTIVESTFSGNRDSGVWAFNSRALNISSSTVNGSRSGGFWLIGSQDLVVINNTIRANGATTGTINAGIYLEQVQTVRVSNNTIESNKPYGIRAEDIVNATITSNTLMGNGFFLTGDTLVQYNSHNITDNTVNGLPILYYKDRPNVTLDAVPIGQLLVVNCTNVRATNLTITDAATGITLAYVDSATLASNTVSSGEYGIRISSSNNLSLEDNVVANNSRGIYLMNSRNTSLRGNIVTNHTYGVYMLATTQTNLTGNTIADGGLSILDSTFATLVANTFVRAGVSLWGGALNQYTSHTITPDNLVDGLPILYYKLHESRCERCACWRTDSHKLLGRGYHKHHARRVVRRNQPLPRPIEHHRGEQLLHERASGHLRRLLERQRHQEQSVYLHLRIGYHAGRLRLGLEQQRHQEQSVYLHLRIGYQASELRGQLRLLQLVCRQRPRTGGR